VIAASLRHTLRGEARRVAPDSIVEIHLHPDCRCEFVTRAGISGEAALLGTSFVAPYLTILNLQPLEGRWARHVVILPDAVNREIFRKLRVVLKWRCGKPSEEA
ncbi:MAG: hypothetical protein KGZ83_09755, partial [Sulfuricella sp.]|nr:hypothetical protein [Sulfuricella sp.]